ncbi:hypothetical protein OAM90_05285, partial [Flavobacteriaceae bacterium]|nr:hypothetical protein [Flavobacteriaceae bacterium]
MKKKIDLAFRERILVFNPTKTSTRPKIKIFINTGGGTKPRARTKIIEREEPAKSTTEPAFSLMRFFL